MPKYVLGTNGNIIDLEDPVGVSGKNPQTISEDYVARGGAAHDSNGDFFKTADVDLPTSLNFDKKGRHAISAVPAPQKDNNSLFPNKEFAGDHNSSFGADIGFDKYINFNNYHTRNEIFATELEIAGTGIDLNSGGLRDLTKFSLAFELIIEAIAYITTIELILQTERAVEFGLDINQSKTVLPNNPFALYEKGNYGSKSYLTISRYFNDILNYPVKSFVSDKPSSRIAAFFIGMNQYINPDLQVFTLKNLFSLNLENPLGAIANYLLDAILTLSNIESNRLMLLIRRFNQKSDWHVNRLYKAKSDTKENAVERFLIELNYYYVKFIIERIHVGQKSLDYLKNKKLKKFKLNRSGRLKDSISSNGLNTLEYGPNKKLSIQKKDTDTLSQEYQIKQSMSNALLPQAFIMPSSFMTSYYNRTGEVLKDFTEKFVNSYFLKTEKHQERLSNDVVKKLEAHYEKEMMPFYFQDLRTNEIIGFHAFIESITDNFNPNYTQTKGFGRIDDVRHYVDTTRNVNITFALAAMSKDDHDLMWYQINKLVSMVYPQWSRGFEASSTDDPGDNGFEYPFTQVPTASPLIRIRLGDIIKSNYTKHAIEKLHGSGNKQKKADISDIPREKYFTINPGVYSLGLPKGMSSITPGPQTTNVVVKQEVELYLSHSIGPVKPKKYTIDEFNKLKPDDEVIVRFVDSAASYSFVTAVSDSDFIITNKSDISVEERGPDYRKLKAENLKIKKSQKKAFKSYTSSYVESDPKILNNPITAAYETTLGKGLAGFITMLDVNYQDQLWETEVNGSKAPKLVKIGINFAPLHDIPPGLDADGAMRAPVYNTGRIINTLYGDVYDED